MIKERVEARRGRGARFARPALISLVLIGGWLGASGPAEAGCFMSCTLADLQNATLLDDSAVREAARRCKASCETESKIRLGVREAAVQACRPTPLPPEAMARVQAASPRFQILLGVFAWETVNPFPDKVLKGISVSRMTPTLARQDFETAGTIGPNEQGAFVVTDMGELIPQLGPTIRVTGILACDLPPAP